MAEKDEAVQESGRSLLLGLAQEAVLGGGVHGLGLGLGGPPALVDRCLDALALVSKGVVEASLGDGHREMVPAVGFVVDVAEQALAKGADGRGEELFGGGGEHCYASDTSSERRRTVAKKTAKLWDTFRVGSMSPATRRAPLTF